jgi:uncharacterized protein (TIGR03118 family)
VRISELTILTRARCAPDSPGGGAERGRAGACEAFVPARRSGTPLALAARVGALPPAVRAGAVGRRIQETENMNPRSLKPGRFLTAATIALALAACNDNNNLVNVIAPLNRFTLTRLVADQGAATTIDPNLINSWGIAFGPTGLLWVANNGTGTATVYNGDGTKVPMTVGIPGTGDSQGVPTGVILNSTIDFPIIGLGQPLTSVGPATFIFAGEDGTISAWNALTPNGNAVLVADRSAEGAVYKGIAMAANGGQNFLYATNFHNNTIDVYDHNFAFVNSFTDPGMVAGFAPFGIANIGGQLFVTYAKQLAPDNHDDQAGVGNGFVDVFNPNGTLARRFASNGTLNSPWGIALAPANFSRFGGDILIGNFGDGLIGAYDPNTGALVDELRDSSGNAISIDGLWGLAFGPFPGATTLYFASGPQQESHGLVGTLTAFGQ